MCAQEFCFQGWVLIPVILCILIMLSRGFFKGRMPIDFMHNSSNEIDTDASVKNKTDSILKERLANGEITIEEYEKMKDILA